MIVVVLLTLFMLRSLHYMVTFMSADLDRWTEQHKIHSTSGDILAILANKSTTNPRGSLKTKASHTAHSETDTQPISTAIIHSYVFSITPTATTSALSTASNKKESQLVSLGKPVASDVRGNLGPPSVVTNEKVADWLADRWQGKCSLITTALLC